MTDVDWTFLPNGYMVRDKRSRIDEIGQNGNDGIAYDKLNTGNGNDTGVPMALDDAYDSNHMGMDYNAGKHPSEPIYRTDPVLADKPHPFKPSINEDFTRVAKEVASCARGGESERIDPLQHNEEKFNPEGMRGERSSVPKNETKHDPVTNPSHYDLFPELGLQAIDVIRAALTEDEFLGYCKGNALKYLLRGGKKTNESDAKDAAKARQYIDLRLEK